MRAWHLRGAGFTVLMAASLLSYPSARAATPPASSPAPKAAAVRVAPASGPIFSAHPKTPALVTSTCSACHGLTGISPTGSFPDLAGQWEPYLVKQIRDFRDHKRADPMAQSIMWGMAAMIPPAKISEIALYFASQKGPAPSPENPKLVAAGRALFMGGEISSHLPACMACHGPTGRGVPPLFPRLAGQHQAYIIAQLQAFKSGQRANDPHAIMRTIAAKLSQADMTALAAYIRTL